MVSDDHKVAGVLAPFVMLLADSCIPTDVTSTLHTSISFYTQYGVG